MKLRRLFGVLAFSCLGAVLVQAQSQSRINGIVQDATTRRPLIGAAVTLGVPPDARITRTDETGSFRFLNVQEGTHVLTVRSLGYLPFSRTATVPGNERVTVDLSRIAALDTVRVLAARRAIDGVVATAHDLQPVPMAVVQVFGPSVGQINTDSTGHFSYPIRSPGPYLLRAKSPGLGTRAVSVTVAGEESIEVVLLLDSVPSPGANALEMAYADFRDRLFRRSNASLVASSGELAARGNGELMPSFLMLLGGRGLRLSREACVFVDGIPRPGFWPGGLDVRDIEMLEAYSISGDRSRTLSAAWPHEAPCGNTGMPGARVPETRSKPSRERASDIVYWVAIWLKH